MKENEYERQKLKENIQKTQLENKELKDLIDKTIAQLQNDKAELRNQCNEKDAEIDQLNNLNRKINNELK